MPDFNPLFHSAYKPVMLRVMTTVSGDDVRDQPNATDRYIREELAIKLAQKMLEEDLIQFEVDQSCAGPLDGNIVRVCAKASILQE